ncbi:hypothetical protein COU62_04840 [Candidatus Pacearchaeota archaeon CG10_big_fil_rev_8_21_14_0_10_35_219]|nr:hypothetical protein [Candidatus Pacearchaeota archaeon]OIO42881.1 MAG: hypothetical protein AUJ63_01560 [Candidatus Pacearchaeota archaeon CG1_02_35_32]PIO07126.1 MAG: hypothetical protein COU62_04840 [Candidatus Pacearchaeota archaeon CG10_big_fil_rev_8_21_14_0_10_35_219]PIY81784.1 MAG: hypothetical protein COY79_00870 [Candidatus Pacearchaeota archaeon CG_4_10_14_0_8_um_filter_35_169]PIZ80922.1 MAG: hypothetical protein COY00_00195 [Candidatus Pacearchaeota archaeon CG_4_10_14_0_2_um_filt
MDKNWVAVMIVGFLGLALVGNFFYSTVAYSGLLLEPPSNAQNFSLLMLLFGIFMVAVFLIGVFFERDWEKEHHKKNRKKKRIR